MTKISEYFTVILLMLTAVNKIRGADHQQHLKCWHCSSDTIGSEEFCGKEFKEANIPVELLKERNLSVVRHCNSTINSEHERPVCRKTVEEMNGKEIIKRFCYYTNKSDPLDHCHNDVTEKNVRRIFCQDCLSEKCNIGHKPFTDTFTVLLTTITTLLIAKIIIN